MENFKIEEIYSFETNGESYDKETEIVNESFLKRNDVYNKKLGGHGGWDHCAELYHTSEHAKMMSDLGSKKGGQALKWLCENDREWFDKRNKQISQTIQKRWEDGMKGSFTSKKHSNESKRKIGEANSKHQTGTGNSQFGTMWIHNLEEKLSKKIKKDELPVYEEQGWLKGRKMKF